MIHLAHPLGFRHVVDVFLDVVLARHEVLAFARWASTRSLDFVAINAIFTHKFTIHKSCLTKLL